MATGDGWVGGISERPTDVNGALLCLSFFFSPVCFLVRCPTSDYSHSGVGEGGEGVHVEAARAHSPAARISGTRPDAAAAASHCPLRSAPPPLLFRPPLASHCGGLRSWTQLSARHRWPLKNKTERLSQVYASTNLYLCSCDAF